MAGRCVPRRTGGRHPGRVLDVSRFDRAPRPVGHARILHVDGGTDATRDTGFDANSDGDRDAASDGDVTPPPPPPTPAAQPGGPRSFRSPSGNINCTLSTPGGENAARCEVVEHTWMAPPPSDCHLNSGDRFYLTQGGHAGVGCYGQEFPAAEHTLGYGQTRSLGTITCDSEYTGMTCTDSSTGHYFRVSRDSYELG